MNKPKKKPTKTTQRKTGKAKKKKQDQGLLPYILMGLVAVVAIWLILQPVKTEPAPKGKDTDEVAQKASPTKKAKSKRSTVAKTKAKRKAEAKAKAKTQTKPKVKAVQKSSSTPDLEPSIIAILKELGVSESIYKRQKRGDTITYQVPLDQNVYDLYYANMVIKGRMEKAGAKMVNAVERGKRQSLSFSLPNAKTIWKLEIYLDSKAYKDKVPSKTLAIVVDDFGEIGGKLLDDFFALPQAVTFAIMPGFANSVTTMERAHAQGRESIAHIPMEPIGYPQVNPGKGAILVQMSQQEIRKTLTKHLDQLNLCIGINNHMGSFATTDKDVMRHVMLVLKERNKLFLDSRTSNVSVAYSEAQKAQIPAFRNHIFLDAPNISDANMDAKIKQLQSMSQSNPNLIAITHCHSREKLVYLQKFIERITKAGFTIVPLSKSGRYHVPKII